MAIATLTKREIIDSHILLGDVYDRYSINRLVCLFNKQMIAKYIYEERRSRQMNANGITIESGIYGIEKDNSTLVFIMKKQNKPFLHFTLQFAPEWLSDGPNDHGVVRIYKDVYDSSIPEKMKYLLYAVYFLEHPHNKPKSLTFSIAYGHSTPLYPTARQPYIDDILRHDEEVKEEMDVITTVLNRLFDEDNVYYIGNYH